MTAVLTPRRRSAVLASICLAVVPATACTIADPADAADTSAASADAASRSVSCGPGGGLTWAPDVLTIATDDPAHAPWVIDNDPANGLGYEGAVARAVSERLGYAPDQVRFSRVAFDDALAPGPKNFDFDINQFTIVTDRRDSVDFSAPYYPVAQSVVALSTNPAAQSRSLADLTELRLGAQRNSTSLAAIEGTIRPGRTPMAFDSTDTAKAALLAGEVDAIVVDLPTGFHITEEQIPGSVIVGQFPRPNDVTEFYGVVLEKDSPLTGCVSAALDGLYDDGTLDALIARWLTDSAGARVLQ
ncbi:transporter substrate-binding domain-containing protein [Rhodococcus hoagii]|nr:transporter substrate-binding domain-containing protein [Prescottella equi]